MTWQRIATIGAFLVAAVVFAIVGQTEMAGTALGLAGGATVPAAKKQ